MSKEFTGLLCQQNKKEKVMKKNIQRIAILLCTLLLTTVVQAQVKVGDNPTSINPSAVLEIESTNKGLLLPRVTLSSTTNFVPLATHVEGMVVYNTATAGDVTPGYYYNDGTQWVRLANAANVGETNTTLALDSTTGLLTYTNENNNNPVLSLANIEPWFGTDNNAGATENTEDIYTMGNVGIGTSNPVSLLHLTKPTGPSVLNGITADIANSGLGRFIDATISDGFTGSDTMGVVSIVDNRLSTPGQNHERKGFSYTTNFPTLTTSLRNQKLVTADFTTNASSSRFANVANLGLLAKLYNINSVMNAHPSNGQIAYNIFLDNPSHGSNDYGLYQNTAGVNNYFAGNVGIGTTTPNEKLEVNGKVRVSDLTGADQATDVIVTADATTGELKEGGTVASLQDGDAWGVTGEDVASNIGRTGRVAIGTTGATTATLDVRNSGTEDILNLRDGTTDVMTVLDGGNVGIGTATPTANAHIWDQLPNIQGRTTFRVDGVRGSGFHTTTAYLTGNTHQGNEDDIVLRIEDVDPLGSAAASGYLLKAFGDNTSVGSGTDLDEIFAVKGTGEVRVNTDQFLVQPDGDVGIGTATPNTKLHIDNGTTNGAIQIEDGTEGYGKILVSDQNGVGTWQQGSGTTDVSGTTVAYPSTGNVWNWTCPRTITLNRGYWAIAVRCRVEHQHHLGETEGRLFMSPSGSTSFPSSHRILCVNVGEANYFDHIYYANIKSDGTVVSFNLNQIQARFTMPAATGPGDGVIITATRMY